MKKLFLLLILLIAVPVFAQEVIDEPLPPEAWNVATNGQLSFLALGGRSTLLRDLFSPVYTLMQSHTGRQPVINLVIRENGLLPGCEIDAEGNAVVLVEETPEPCSADLVELAGYDVIEPTANESLEHTVSLTLLERFYPTERFPVWFASGLADFYAPSPQVDRLSRVRDAARSSRLYTMVGLESLSGDPLWQSQSYGMILYILDRIGVEGLFALAGETGDFREAYQRRLGEPLSALLPNWQNWIFTRAAEAAYGITPYQPITLTPTPSNTPTLTATFTPTPTDFAVLNSTSTPPRAPTVTPSRTLTAYPPTVTPRSPGSPLIAPTQVPLPPQTFSLPQINIVAVLIVLLVILILVYIVLSYRR